MSLKVFIYSDFICPYCYLGMGLLSKLKEEFDLIEEWLPYELHPETPAGGALLADFLPDVQWGSLYKYLQKIGAEYHTTFGDVKRISNSHNALEAAEFARDSGCYDAFHQSVFKAYFVDCRDIGDMQVLAEFGAAAGLDAAAMLAAVRERRYAEHIAKTMRQANLRGFEGAPYFLIDGLHGITGIQPLEVYRKAIRYIDFVY